LAKDPSGILADLQGPENPHRPRLGPAAATVNLRSGQQFIITTAKSSAIPRKPPVNTTFSPAAPLKVKAGDRILLSDGLIELRVEKKTPPARKFIFAAVVNGRSARRAQGQSISPGRESPSRVPATDAPKTAKICAFALAPTMWTSSRRQLCPPPRRRLLGQKPSSAAPKKDTPVISKLEKAPKPLKIWKVFCALVSDGRRWFGAPGDPSGRLK